MSATRARGSRSPTTVSTRGRSRRAVFGDKPPRIVRGDLEHRPSAGPGGWCPTACPIVRPMDTHPDTTSRARAFGGGLLVSLTLCAACGTATPATPRNAGRGSSSAGEIRGDSTSDDGTVAGDRTPDDEGVISGPCGGLSAGACAETSACVFDPTCRPTTHACEAVRPVQLTYGSMPPGGHGNPDFGGGDPCARLDPACAFDLGRGICTPFVARTDCPATRDEAAAAPVFCMHPSQPALDCPFDGGWCACRPPPPYCGGAQPSPGTLNQPTTWACADDASPTGCPSRAIREGTRCNVDGDVQCIEGCYALYQCVRRRWRITENLPPRP